MPGNDYETRRWNLIVFLARRIVGPCFVVGGTVLALFGLYWALIVGEVNVNGQPSTDPVFLAIGVLVPALGVGLGIALMKVRVANPPTSSAPGEPVERRDEGAG